MSATPTTPRWNPWETLRQREHIQFALDGVAAIGGGALYARRRDRAAIVIDPALSRRERRVALAHELVHDARGVPAGEVPAALVAKEERCVEREVARRLVPADELRRFASSRLTVGSVTARDIADEFDVPDAVAVLAVEQLAPSDRPVEWTSPRPIVRGVSSAR